MVDAGGVSEQKLLADARRDDEAFELLVQRHRGELFAHCYRMLREGQPGQHRRRRCQAPR